MSSDNVSTTAPEGRKSTKPIMEKRRRARINACLAELKSLLMDVIKAEGARHSKMEKADILEMTVRHLRQLQRQSIAGIRPQEQSTQSKYRMGYLECINEVGRFLGSLEIEEVDLRTKIIEHLANCVAGAKQDSAETEISTSTGISHTPTVIRPRPEKPVSSLINRADICIPVTDSNSIINLSLPQTIKQNPLGTQKPPGSTGNAPVINLYASSPLRMSSLPLSNVQNGQMITTKPSQLIKETQNTTEKHELVISNVNRPFSCDNHPKPVVIGQPDVNVKLVGTPSATTISQISSTQVFGGLQLLPTQLPSGEIAFVVPANLVPTTQTPSYVIPILSPKNLTSSSNSPLVQPVNQSPNSNVMQSFGPAFKPVSINDITTVSSVNQASKFQHVEPKAVIPTSADASPSLHYICDSKTNDLINAKTNELYPTHQNVLSSQMATGQPQYLAPIKQPSSGSSIPCSQTEVGAVSNKPFSCLKQASDTTAILQPFSLQTKSSSEYVIPQHGLYIPRNGETTGRTQENSDHLVLNLAMQNRTRADQEHAQSNFHDEDDSMWRPW